MIRFLLLLSSLIAAQTIVGPTIHAQCNDSTACNYDAAATGAGVSPLSPCLTLDPHVVHTSGAFAGMTTYRLYVHLPESDDFLSAISTINIGCTDFNACNYAPNADYDDGSCEYSSCSPGDIPVDTPASSSTIKIRTTTRTRPGPEPRPERAAGALLDKLHCESARMLGCEVLLLVLAPRRG